MTISSSLNFGHPVPPGRGLWRAKIFVVVVVNGEGELRGKLANAGAPGKWPLKRSVFGCVCVIFVFRIVMLKGTESFAIYSVVLTMLAITPGGLTFWIV